MDEICDYLQLNRVALLNVRCFSCFRLQRAEQAPKATHAGHVVSKDKMSKPDAQFLQSQMSVEGTSKPRWAPSVITSPHVEGFGNHHEWVNLAP